MKIKKSAIQAKEGLTQGKFLIEITDDYSYDLYTKNERKLRKGTVIDFNQLDIADEIFEVSREISTQTGIPAGEYFGSQLTPLQIIKLLELDGLIKRVSANKDNCKVIWGAK